MSWYSYPLIIKYMQIKSQMRLYFIAIRVAEIRKMGNPSPGEEERWKEHCVLLSGSLNLLQLFRKAI